MRIEYDENERPQVRRGMGVGNDKFPTFFVSKLALTMGRTYIHHTAINVGRLCFRVSLWDDRKRNGRSYNVSFGWDPNLGTEDEGIFFNPSVSWEVNRGYE